MNRNFDDILNECLERLGNGESLEDCLKIYPDEAERLAPMLKIAQATRRAASSIEPRTDFKAQALYRLSREMAHPHKSRNRFFRLPRAAFATPVLLGMGSLFLVFGGAAGVSAASGGSVPGDPLYPVKTAKEWVLLSMPRSDMARARLQADLAQRREEEIAELAGRGDVDKVQALTKRLNRHLETATYLAVNRPPGAQDDEDTRMLRGYLKEKYQQHQQMLQTSVQNTALHLRPRMRQSLEESSEKFEAAISTLGEGSGVAMAFDPEAGYIVFRPRFGPPVFLALTGDTKVFMNDQETSLSSLAGMKGSGISLVFDPFTRLVQEIRLSK